MGNKFKGSHEITNGLIFLVVLFGVVIVVSEGITPDTLKGLVILLFCALLFYLDDLFTFTYIDDALLKNSSDFFRSFSVPVKSIDRVDRGSMFIFKSGGSRMEIVSRDEEGGTKIKTIRESSYSIETIKQILRMLKEFNTGIILDPQYQDLIDGKIKDEKKFKEIDPTIH